MVAIETDKLLPRFFSPGQSSEIWGRKLCLAPGLHVVEAPSGRGKTSLVRHLAGLDGLCDGTVVFTGRDDRRRPVACLDQALASVGLLDGMETLRLGLPDGEWKLPLLADMLADLELDGIVGRKTASFSRGELQRLLFVRTLLQEADWYILDEPFSHVDPVRAGRMLAWCRKRVGEGRGVLITSLDAALDHLAPANDTRLWRL